MQSSVTMVYDFKISLLKGNKKTNDKETKRQSYLCSQVVHSSPFSLSALQDIQDNQHQKNRLCFFSEQKNIGCKTCCYFELVVHLSSILYAFCFVGTIHCFDYLIDVTVTLHSTISIVNKTQSCKLYCD